MAIHGKTWQFMSLDGNAWQHIATHGQYMDTFGNTNHYIAI